MRPQVLVSVALAGLIVAGVGGGRTSAIGFEAAGTCAIAGSAPAAGILQPRGRFKLDGENCVWDAKDEGPNQCTPRTPGRFKKEKDECVWDGKDNGPDQCTPARGRWKVDGERCYWDAKDDGPHQCNPRQPRK